MGSILGESAAEQKTRIAEATKGANDLTGLIRKKPSKAEKPKGVDVVAAAAPGAKRKLEDSENGGDVLNGKKAKVEDNASA